MDFEYCYKNSSTIIMEGALGERLKHEFGFGFDADLALATFIYDEEKKAAINSLWLQYIEIARNIGLPFIATTPTRRVNIENIENSSYNKNIIKDNVNNLKKLLSPNMYAGGLMGCRGDAYKCTDVLNINEAEKFHSWAADLFAEA